jgi:MFS transporter, DHA1 family, multidrug resistance protein
MITTRLAFTLAFLHALQSLSTDIYIVALPLIGRDFGVSEAQASYSMISFVLGLAFSHLFAGALADYYGRKPVAIAGLLLYLAATVFAFMATSNDMLVIARFVQGIATGAAGPIMMRAIGRDNVQPQDAPALFARVSLIAAFGPVLAPFIGGVTAYYGGWRLALAVLMVYCVLLILIVIFSLKESLKPEHKAATPLGNPFKSLMVLLQNRDFRHGALLIFVGYGALFSWLSTGAFYMTQSMGYSADDVAKTFIICACTFLTGTFIAKSALKHFSEAVILRYASIFAIVGTCAGVWFIGQKMPWYLMFLSVVPFYLGWGILQPISMGIAMRPFAGMAGVASAWFGIAQFMGAASFTYIAGIFGGGKTALVLMIVTMVVVLIVAFIKQTGSKA